MASPATSPNLTGTHAQVQEHLAQLLNSFGFEFTNALLAVVLGASALLLLVLRRVASGSKPNYPPGPKPLPVLGNALDIPDKAQWITFAKWGAQYGTSHSARCSTVTDGWYAHYCLPHLTIVHRQHYVLDASIGDIVHVEALGTHIVVINSHKVAFEMLEKKGKLYSERPTLMMAGRLVGWEEGPALIGFNETWSEYRRLMAQFMGTRNKIDKFDFVLKDQANVLLDALRTSPQKWGEHVGQ
jgi:hypothetical protein